MSRPRLEVADILRAHGAAWRRAQAGHLSLGQLKVMSAIEQCRSAALGGHGLRCADCATTQHAYNSCRNRHCPKCQGGAAAHRWLDARQADLLPVEYYHVVFTLPAPISDIAYTNKDVMYALLFKAAAETLTTIAADPKHLGARIGLTAVLPTCTVWYRAAVCRWTVNAGSRVVKASSYQCVCSRAYSDDCSSSTSTPRTTTDDCSSSVSTKRSASAAPSAVS